MGKDKKTTQTQSGSQSGSQSNAFNNQQSGGYSGMTGLDPNSQGYVDWQRMLAQQGVGAALGSGGTLGPNAGMLQALQGMGGASSGFNQALGQLGASAGSLLGTNALAGQIPQLMNPYLQGVVDPTRAEFDVLRGQARKATTQQALAGGAGAYGSARHGVLEGTRLGELDRAQASQIANLMSGGYDKAQQAALQLQQQAATGLGGIGAALGNSNALDLQRQQQLFQNYDYLRQIQQQQGMDPASRYAQALQFANQGLGPTGQQTSGQQYSNQSGTSQGTQQGSYQGTNTQVQKGNAWNDLLGLGLTIGPMLLGLPPMGGLGGGGGQQNSMPVQWNSTQGYA